MQFSWDEAKDRANLRKHGLSFDEAEEIFRSDDYLEIFSEDHSEVEDRFIAIGFIAIGFIARGLVVVVWTPVDEDSGRIISARPAKGREERLFESYVGIRHD